MSRRLLDVLHSSEPSEIEVVNYAKQVAAAMDYLHHKLEVLHCDLAARNISFPKLEFPLTKLKLQVSSCVRTSWEVSNWGLGCGYCVLIAASLMVLSPKHSEIS